MLVFYQQQEHWFSIEMTGSLPQTQKINAGARRNLRGSREIIYRENYIAILSHLELEKLI